VVAVADGEPGTSGRMPEGAPEVAVVFLAAYAAPILDPGVGARPS
jgi:hypothetical protein